MAPRRRDGRYTVEEVAEHNTPKSLWVVMNRKVYDVTVFHTRHPGGPAVLLQMGGRDATAAATAAHKNILPSNLMWEFCIGNIVRTKKTEAVEEVAPAAPVAAVSAAASAAPKSAPLKTPAVKAKAKAKAVIVAAERSESSEAGSSSRSANEGSERDDEDSDPERQEPKNADSELTLAADRLYEKMLADHRLSRWVQTSPKQDVLNEVKRFIRVAMDPLKGAVSGRSVSSDKLVKKESSRQAIQDIKSRLDERYDDLVEVLLSFMQRPLALGEDRLLHALSSSCKDTSDPQLNKLLENVSGSPTSTGVMPPKQDSSTSLGNSTPKKAFEDARRLSKELAEESDPDSHGVPIGRKNSIKERKGFDQDATTHLWEATERAVLPNSDEGGEEVACGRSCFSR